MGQGQGCVWPGLAVADAAGVAWHGVAWLLLGGGARQSLGAGGLAAGTIAAGDGCSVASSSSSTCAAAVGQ